MPDVVSVPLIVAAFVGGIALVVAATDRLVDALLGLAGALGLTAFTVSAVVSGMEAENVAVGLAAAARGNAAVALGTAYGGAMVMLCWALGLGAVIAPLRVRLPRTAVLLLPLSALAAGLPAWFAVTPRWTGAGLLAVFVVALALLARAARRHRFLAVAAADEVATGRSLSRVIGWTAVALLLLAVGGDVVAWGAGGLVSALGLSAGFVGMVLTPLGIEAEEIVRQVVPARRGRPDIAAGNAVGTVLWFLLFNLGLIALVVPVAVPPRVRLLDWPAVVVAAVVACAFLLRGRVGRLEGAVLLGIGLAYAAAQLALR